MPSLGLALTLDNYLKSGISPWNVAGNVLSLVANRPTPTSGTMSPWKDNSRGYDVSCTNAVVNGDFSNGTTGWIVANGTLTVSGNKATVTGSGSNATVYITDTSSRVLGRKYYGVVRFRVTNSVAIRLRLVLAGGGIVDVNSPIANEWYYRSVIQTAGSDSTTNISAQHTYADAATANGKVMEVQEVMCIDLTTPFTAGREPSIEDFNRALADAGTTYWNGAKTLRFRTNATLSNFAGTATSGWVQEWIPSQTGVEYTLVDAGGGSWSVPGASPAPSAGEITRLVAWATAKYGTLTSYTFKMARRWMIRLDGSDDFMSLVNSASLDLGVVAGKEQAWAVTFRLSIGGAAGYMLCKNNTDFASVQYGVGYDSASGTIQFNANGGTRTTTGTSSVVLNEFYNVIFYRNSVGLITPYLQKVSKPTETYANALTTQPNVRIGRRETAAAHFKGDIASLSLYEATKLDINQILRAEWQVARDYIA